MMNIREKITGTSWAQTLLDELREELDVLSAAEGFQIPVEPGGWWHQYVCPEHHTELLFDPLEADAMQYKCPHGCVLSGEPYRGAWLVYKHQSLARYALQAAAVYSGTGEASYAELARTILERYARQFPLYPIHPDAQGWMLKGRAFHQALSEAIWATTLIRAYLLLKDEGLDFKSAVQPLAVFFDMLETSMAQYRQILIFERKSPQNNYTAWLNAALAGVYAATGERSKLEALISGEGGLRHHLSIGVKPDQFEFEGSTYYHVFVLRAYLIMGEMAERLGFDMKTMKGEEGQTFEGMLDILAELANDSGYLPALHDGPYQRLAYAREIAEIFEIGLAHYGKAEHVPVLAEAYRQIGSEQASSQDEFTPKAAGWRNSLEALVFGIGDTLPSSELPPRPSLWLPDSGFAVGRVNGNRLSFLADFGAHGGSHGHYDKLHVSLEHAIGGSLSPELGMVPYGSALRKSWYAGTSSHNTVSVNGQSQLETTGEAVQWSASDKAVYLWMRANDAYPGCVLQRHLFQTDAFILDWFDVVLESEATAIDWWYHGLGSFKLSIGEWEGITHSDKPSGQSAGYEYIDAHGKVAGDRRPGALLLEQQLPTGINSSIQLWLHANSNVYHVDAPGPADNPAQRMKGLLHRIEGTKATFIALYHAGEQPVELRFATGLPVGEAHYTKAEFIIDSIGNSWNCRYSNEQGLSFTKHLE
ncbi:heparinase II/III domain-containing protein [Paenibacillus agricola]|uniref:Alginate lyase family protein n=1 Tax=Paenibacillus agricola TaxID=2716264 RepID=A0ABX0IXF5_9BACL|nr:heparinase II/III family protein [Paenibacillus agricola]NHN28517.1 alginate lyase family protein [Paenibacillus agricola]